MKSQKKLLCLLAVLALFIFGAFAIDLQPVIISPLIEESITEKIEKPISTSYIDQLGGVDSTSVVDLPLRLLRVFSTEDYPVISGDQYLLTYYENGKIVSYPITVPYNKVINLGVFGSIDASALNYLELKAKVEKQVLGTYQYSNPQFLITSTGVFPISVKGEVVKATQVDAWGLTRLSDVAYLALDNASTRKVMVKKADGTETSYDLYAALMEGDASQNPYLTAKDTVIFQPKTKQVEIYGEVARAGAYQIEDKEDLVAAITRYAKGFAPTANRTNVAITRNSISGIENLQINANSRAIYALSDGDKIFVKANEVEYPSISLEGALIPSKTDTNYIQGAYTSKYFYKFAPEETLIEMLETVSSLFSSYSDLKEATLIRNGEEMKLNLEDILYKNAELRLMRLEAGDKIYIPFSQMLVTVNGAVNKAGAFGYVPGRTLSYYLNQAGGLANNAKGMDKIKVYDKFGSQIASSEIIPSEAIIEVERDTFATNIAPIVTVVGLVGSIVSIALNVAYLITAATK